MLLNILTQYTDHESPELNVFNIDIFRYYIIYYITL